MSSCCFLLLLVVCFFDVAPCATFAARSDSVFFCAAFAASVFLSLPLALLWTGRFWCFTPHLEAEPQEKEWTFCVSALRCLKLSLQLHSKDVGSRSGAAETINL